MPSRGRKLSLVCVDSEQLSRSAALLL